VVSASGQQRERSSGQDLDIIGMRVNRKYSSHSSETITAHE
jgi:hypothetical protein